MIVPLKILAGYHGNNNLKLKTPTQKEYGCSVVSILFHPRQPWIVSAGLDGVINLFQDI